MNCHPDRSAAKWRACPERSRMGICGALNQKQSFLWSNPRRGFSTLIRSFLAFSREAGLVKSYEELVKEETAEPENRCRRLSTLTRTFLAISREPRPLGTLAMSWWKKKPPNQRIAAGDLIR